MSRRAAIATGVAGLGLATTGTAVADDDANDDSDDGDTDQSIRRHDHSGEFGTANRLGEAAPVESIDVERLRAAHFELDNGPVVTTSEYDTFQAALEDAAGGLLLVNDTKTEEGITFAARHSGTHVYFLGDNAIEQPEEYTPGMPVIQAGAEEGDLDENVSDITIENATIYNPHLDDDDIVNPNTIDDSTARASAIETTNPSNYHLASFGGGSRDRDPDPTKPGPDNWTIINGHFHHVQGYGVAIQNAYGTISCINCRAHDTVYDGFYTRPSGGPGNITEFRNCVAIDNNRHNFTVAGSPNEDRIDIVGCVGKRAWAAGIDIENGRRVNLDAEIYEPSQRGYAGSVSSALNISGWSRNVSGELRVHDPEFYVGHLTNNAGPPVDDLTIIVEQSADQNPGGVTPVYLNPTGGNGHLTYVQRGGGHPSGAIEMITCRGINIDVITEDVYGPAVLVNRSTKNDINVSSKNAVQGSDDADYSAHVAVTGLGVDPCEDNDIKVVATDDDANAEYGVYEGSNADYNRYSGSVRNAYTESATILNENSDDSDLMG